MRSLILFLCTATLTLVAAEPPSTIHVATNGNDAWSGRLPAPNADRTDGPLASVLAARNAARAVRQKDPKAAIQVLIRGGTYRMAEPLVLEPADSGTPDAPLVFAAYQRERPVLSGGRVLTGWKQRGKLWECVVPEVKSGNWYFRQLFVNGERRQRARHPNDGYFRLAGTLPGKRLPDGKQEPDRSRFVFRPGDVQPWERLSDAQVVLMHSWETSFHPIKSVDTESNIVEFTAPLKEWWTITYWEKAQRYYLENAFEILDQPGEWYLNRATGVLSYYALPGERMDAVEVVAPVLTDLVRLEGNADRGQFIRHVTFRGLAFHHADWILDPKGNSSTQAAVETPAALVADGALHCLFDSCEVAHIGTYGLWFRRGCKDSRVTRTRFHDLGAGGIRIGEDKMAKTDEAETSRITAENNHIYNGGRVYAAGIGIWVGQSSHNRIAHNDIHDLLYSGISVGWNWGDSPTRTHHNLIEQNHVHHLVHGVLSDSGLIYCLGTSPGSIIRNNLFHDIWPYQTPAFGWGIYLDATCNGYLVESNVVYHTHSGGLFYNNGGHEHVIRNNIFALPATHGLWPFFEKRPNTFISNIVYLTQGDLIIPLAEASLQQRLNARESLGVWDSNLYWHTGGPDQLLFLRRTFEEWQVLGLDRSSKIADPLFADVQRFDFTLRPGSPALAMGFQPINLSRVGLYGDPDWVAEPRQIKHPPTVLPPPPKPPEPKPQHEDFEKYSPGSLPEGWTVDGEADGASIRVTDARAASGKRSLHIKDSPNARPSWQPHFFYEPRFLRGRVEQRFDLWLEPGALFFTEWRDQSTYPGNVGPSLTFSAQSQDEGSVTLAGRKLATIPLSTWVTVSIQSTLGKNAPRHFTFTLTTPGKPPQKYEHLEYSGKAFHELHWLGFSSTATQDTSFYLDNIHISPSGL